MPYSKAITMIEDCKKPNLDNNYPGASDISVKNAKQISELVYKTYPKLDISGTLTCLCIFHSEKGIIVELSNEFGIFAFTCNNDGQIHYYQCMRGADSTFWEEDYKKLPNEKEIVRHIKRKRLPYNKKQRP